MILILGMSLVKRTRRAVCDLKHHIVCVPKYRTIILQVSVAEKLKEIFRGIAERYEFEIDTMEAMDDHVHLFLSGPPRYTSAEIVQILKSISAKMVFQECPEIHLVISTFRYFFMGNFNIINGIYCVLDFN